MDKGRYSIIFSSLTGNTKKLADTIRAVLPSEDCDYFGAPETAELHSEMLYVGFWTDKGNADSAVLQLLSKLRGKKIFLFGTAGFGGSAAYFQKILKSSLVYVEGGLHAEFEVWEYSDTAYAMENAHRVKHQTLWKGGQQWKYF